MKKINLEEIARKSFFPSGIDDYVWKLYWGSHDFATCVIAAMKEACRQTLELGAENVSIKSDSRDDYSVDKQSIINTINQIE